jgi:hypothetical protein
MHESTTVTVGLDVPARSNRSSALRADELLEERTLPESAAPSVHALAIVLDAMWLSGVGGLLSRCFPTREATG